MPESSPSASGAKLIGGALCLDLVNTVGNWHDPERRADSLTSYSAFLDWTLHAGALTPAEATALARSAVKRPAEAAAVLGRAANLRRLVRAVALAVSRGLPPAADDLAAFDTFIGGFLAGSRLVATPTGFALNRQDDPTTLDRPLWPIVRSALDLLTGDHLPRLRECADDACGWLFLDTSRGGRRRWCDMSDCGNIAKARRFRHRQRAAPPANPAVTAPVASGRGQ